MPKFTHEQKCHEAMDILTKRRVAVVKLVEARKITATEAERLTNIMAEMAEDYERAWKRQADTGGGKLTFAISKLREIVETSQGIGVAFKIATAALAELEK